MNEELPFETGSLQGDLARAAELTRQGTQRATAAAVAPTPSPVAEPALRTARLETPRTTTIPATSLAQQITSGDLSGIMAQNQELLRQQLAAFQPSPERRAVAEQLNRALERQRALTSEQVTRAADLRLQGAEVGQPIVGRQLAALQSEVGIRELPIAQEIASLTDRLRLFEEERQNTVQQLNILAEQGRYNAGLAMRFNEITRAEQAEARKLAREYGITSPFYIEGGTVYRTSDGKPYSSEEQFFNDPQVAASGITNFDQAKSSGLLADLGLSIAQKMDLEKLGIAKTELALKVAEQEASNSGADPEATLDILQKYLNQSKTFTTVKEAYGRILSSDNTPAGDIALIFNYMKMLDPGSVVREGEFATAQNAAGVPDIVRNLYNRAMQGTRLNTKQIADFRQQAGNVYQSQAEQQRQLQQYYTNIAGITPGVAIDLAVPDLTQMGGQQPFVGPLPPGLDTFQQRYELENSSGTGPTWKDWFNKLFNVPKASAATVGLGGMTTNTTVRPLSQTMALPRPEPLKGLSVQSLVSTAAQKYPANSFGDQCGYFVRRLTNSLGFNYPAVGNTLKEKTATANKYGVPVNQAKIGSVILTNESRATGHVAMVIGITPQGFKLAESNFKGDGKVQYGRILPFNSPKLIGVINPTKNA